MRGQSIDGLLAMDDLADLDSLFQDFFVNVSARIFLNFWRSCCNLEKREYVFRGMRFGDESEAQTYICKHAFGQKYPVIGTLEPQIAFKFALPHGMNALHEQWLQEYLAWLSLNYGALFISSHMLVASMQKLAVNVEEKEVWGFFEGEYNVCMLTRNEPQLQEKLLRLYPRFTDTLLSSITSEVEEN